ncbi:MAG: hypothetical protein ACREN2_10285 [Candidatus Dormibacteria bacterium]
MTDSTDERWDRYGRALLQGMQEVLAETAPELHSMLLETADCWLSIGLAIGSTDAGAATQLLNVIEAEEPERAELAGDAAQFVSDALG